MSAQKRDAFIVVTIANLGRLTIIGLGSILRFQVFIRYLYDPPLTTSVGVFYTFILNVCLITSNKVIYQHIALASHPRSPMFLNNLSYCLYY